MINSIISDISYTSIIIIQLATDAIERKAAADEAKLHEDRSDSGVESPDEGSPPRPVAGVEPPKSGAGGAAKPAIAEKPKSMARKRSTNKITSPGGGATIAAPVTSTTGTDIKSTGK